MNLSHQNASVILWLCKVFSEHFCKKKKKNVETFEVKSDWIKTQYFRFSGNLREKLVG